MDAQQYIQLQIAAVRRLTDMVIKDITDEEFNWTPPGSANAIKVSAVHVFGAEDSFIQRFARGKPTIWLSGGWSRQLGLTAPPGRGEHWEEVRDKNVAIVPVLAYGRAVRAATDAYLSSLAPEELDREVQFMGGQRPVAEVIAQLVVHTMHHLGEIATVRGLQGGKGLPF